MRLRMEYVVKQACREERRSIQWDFVRGVDLRHSLYTVYVRNVDVVHCRHGDTTDVPQCVGTVDPEAKSEKEIVVRTGAEKGIVIPP
jgi:hypothetical protein